MKSTETFAAILLLALLPSCGGGGAPVDSGSPLGEAGDDDALEEALADSTVAATAIGLARAVLYEEPAPDTSGLDALPGRRVFLCAYQEKPTRICRTGVGANLAASVKAAATALAAEHGGKVRADISRLKLDVATKVEGDTFKRDIEKPKKRKVALSGYWVEDAVGEVSWILPSELLERGIYSNARRRKGVPRKAVVKAMRQRNDKLGELPEEFDYTRVWTIAWVEKDEPGSIPPGVFRLYRLHAYDFDEYTPDRLLQRVVWAADYLMSSVSSKGKVRYTYRTARDNDSSSYNLLRHGGTTYSILQAYDRTRYKPYLDASVQAMAYLMDHTDRDERTGPYLPKDHPSFGESLYIVSPRDAAAPEGKVKLGGAGLALVMFDQYVEATGDTETYREDAQALARFLVASLKEDGEFLYFPPRHPGGPLTSTDDSEYYPGEAIFGLIRLYSWDRNELWLEAAVRASDWLIDTRDKGKDARRLANDHWLMLALSHVYFYTQDRRYYDHSIALCRAVEYQYLKNKAAWDEYPDFRGGYYDPPRSTPAATRGEGLGAVLETCRQVEDSDCGWIADLLAETVRHEMLSQYDPDMSYWMKNRKKAFGGWNGGLLDTDIRNDFVQHNMSALIGAERYLRHLTGTELPGGPGYTERRLAGSVAWEGIPAEELAILREATMRYRGATRWEKAE